MKKFLRGLKKGSTEIGEDIVIIINTILLLIVYIFGVGLTSIIAKIVGKKFLDTKINKRAKTYWSDLNLKTQNEEEYYRQF